MPLLRTRLPGLLDHGCLGSQPATHGCKKQDVAANIVILLELSFEAREPFLSDATFQLAMRPKSCKGPVIPVLCHVIHRTPLHQEMVFLKTLQRICLRSLPLLLLVIIVFANQGRRRIEVDV